MRTRFEAEGGDAFGRVKRSLEASDIDPESVLAITIEVEHGSGDGDQRAMVRDPDEHPDSDQTEDDTEPDEADTAVDAEPDVSAGSGAEPETEEDDEETVLGISVSDISSVRPDTDAARVLKLLDDNDDQHYHTPQIRGFAKDSDWDSPDGISRRLSYLSDRGLVDRQPSDEDKRMNKYKITDKGRAAAELNRRRSE